MGYELHQWGVELEAYDMERVAVQQIVESIADTACLVRDDNRPSSVLCWAVVHDGSINKPGEFELRTPAMIGEGKAWDQLKAVCKAVREAGAKVGPTCGFHVHQDASMILKAARPLYGDQHRTTRHIMCAGHELYARMEGIIDTLLPPSRRANNNPYCTSLLTVPGAILPETTLYDAMRGRTNGLHPYNTNNGREHHTKLSVSAMLVHNTLEYRQHSGTLLASKILPWVKLTGLIQARIGEIVLQAESIPETFTSLTQLLDYLEAGPTLRQYWTERQMRMEKAIPKKRKPRITTRDTLPAQWLAYRHTRWSGQWQPITKRDSLRFMDAVRGWVGEGTEVRQEHLDSLDQSMRQLRRDRGLIHSREQVVEAFRDSLSIFLDIREPLVELEPVGVYLSDVLHTLRGSDLEPLQEGRRAPRTPPSIDIEGRILAPENIDYREGGKAPYLRSDRVTKPRSLHEERFSLHGAQIERTD